VLAVACHHRVPAGAGRTLRADELAARLPRRAWQRLPAGAGAKGQRWYDWAWITVDDDAPGHRHLLIRRNRVGTQPGRSGDAPGPQRPPRIGQDLQQVPVGGRQHRQGKARPPRRHRHHPDRRAGRRVCFPSRRLVRPRPAEDLRDRFPGDLQPGQPLLSPRKPIVQPRDLTAQLIRLLAGRRLTPPQFLDQRSHRTSPRSYPEQ
jgi:hypothetical protein